MNATAFAYRYIEQKNKIELNKNRQCTMIFDLTCNALAHETTETGSVEPKPRLVAFFVGGTDTQRAHARNDECLDA